MRVPLSWLRDYVDVQLEPDRLAECLTILGMEVQRVERWGSDWQGVVVGELLAVEKHPRADRLSLTRVRVDDGEPLEIVCGATNIAPGQRVPVALPGAVLPGGRSIERTEKLGFVSNGMLCSGDELHLTGDAEGILILPPETPLGARLTDLYGDWVLDVDVKPNRGDALCLLGVAREVSAATGAQVRLPDTVVDERGVPVADRLAVEIEDTHLCPRFVGRWVSGVRVGPSPDSVQARLLAAGLRPVSNVVDATNYVMLELGKPIHAFDAATVARDAGGRARIVVRPARTGERLETLDHAERELGPETLLIADRSGPLAIAGVMGGAASEVSEATTEVIIESAIFDPVSIRRTAFRYALRSEASLRFEKGQEARLARVGADRVSRLVSAWSGGTVAPGRVDSAPDEPQPGRVAFRPARIRRLLGTDLDAAEQRALLARVGVETEPAAAATPVPVAAQPRPLAVPAAAGEALIAVVPTWRRDLVIEADVAEEIARVAGYDTLPTKTPDTAMPPWRPDPLELRDALRSVLVGAGLTEVVTPALVAPGHAEFAWPVGAADGIAGEERTAGRPIRVTNPLSENRSVLRPGLVASLLDVLAWNERHGRNDVAIFELGKGYAAAPDGTAGEWWRLGFLLAGDVGAATWNQPARPYDTADARGLVELVARIAGLTPPDWTPHRDGSPLHPGRAALASARGAGGTPSLAGLVGELHPDVAAAWDLRASRVLAGELAIARLSGGGRAPTHARPLSRHPAVERDLAVVVAEAVPAGPVAATIRTAAGERLADLRLFDVYRGSPLGPGEKSLAWRLVFESPDGPLAEADIEAAMARVGAALLTGHGGRVRI
ncbi:MAG: phenylalanyl-tRNA synthetase, beta subunit [Chloroflexi bacterium]|nr:phenylalanyl-tRNA synthetase, beta subunit [Chloroflexota bacterium]